MTRLTTPNLSAGISVTVAPDGSTVCVVYGDGSAQGGSVVRYAEGYCYQWDCMPANSSSWKLALSVLTRILLKNG